MRNIQPTLNAAKSTTDRVKEAGKKSHRKHENSKLEKEKDVHLLLLKGEIEKTRVSQRMQKENKQKSACSMPEQLFVFLAHKRHLTIAPLVLLIHTHIAAAAPILAATH